MSYENPYYIEELRIKELHELGYTGKGIEVIVIDTGCDYNHKELKNKLFAGVNFTTENDNNYYNYMDLNGHGTGVVGEIIKIAPDVKITVVKCMDKNGSGKMNNIIKSLEFAIKQKPDIINMSIGTRGKNSDLENAIKNGVKNNISIVCACGNDGDGKPITNEFNYPASYEPVISVGALTKDYQPCFFSASNDLIDLLTFGDDIESIYPNDKYGTANGTSQATPIVTGVLALMKQYLRETHEPTEDELYKMLISNTKEIENIDKELQGFGYLYLENFINLVNKKN